MRHMAHRSKAERAATGKAARADDSAAFHDAIDSGRIAAATGL